MLTREEILGRKPKRQTVVVPQWDDTVLIQSLTLETAQAIGTESGPESILDMVIASVITEDGKPMFSPEDKENLRRLEATALKAIAEAAVKFNGLTGESVEGLAKNSETGPNGASSSA